jgi:hypothetical protein
MSTLIAASRALYHNGSRPLAEIEPFWPAAKVRVRVERLIDADHPRIDQVVYVSDVSPSVDGTSTGSEFAKLISGGGATSISPWSKGTSCWRCTSSPVSTGGS